MTHIDTFDIVVVGGGINGAGIACDAAGRGLKVLMAEKGDLASATSSASSKLIHGGLRYLEHFEFKLVRHALAEREVLMHKAPHIIWPLRFVLPHIPGLRPQWMIRAGLFLYDHLYQREVIPGSRRIDLRHETAYSVLRPELTSGFSYYDCWADDSRLVLLNAQAARDHGAEILTRTRVTAARRDGDFWRVTLLSGNVQRDIAARTLINAAGPWAGAVDGLAIATTKPSGKVRLVKGSHIVLPRIPGIGETAFLMQNADKRVVFALPFEEAFTIIGTTDIAYDGDPSKVVISNDEERYLIDLAQKFFRVPLRQSDIIWRYSGVRPLFDDNADDPSAVTRDYRLDVSGGESGQPARLSVYGGKVTTYRVLAEDALEKLRPMLPQMRPPWTAKAALPGGDLPASNFDSFLADLKRRYAGFDARHLLRLARRHGAGVADFLGDARTLADLGRHFGEGLTEREVLHMKRFEWAASVDDVLWRRSKVGLHMLRSMTAGERDEAYAAIARLL